MNFYFLLDVLDTNVQIIMSKKWSKKLGKIIAEYREANDLPLRKLAADLDLDQSTLSKIEKGNRMANIEMIPVIAKLFNIDFQGIHTDILSDKIIEENKNYPFFYDALLLSLDKLNRSKS